MNIAADRPNLSVAISRDAQSSLLMVAFMPAALVVGYVLRGLLFGDPHVPGSPRRWEAAMLTLPLWIVVEIPSVLGIVRGRRAVRAGEPPARTSVLSNGVIFAHFAVTTVVVGLVDAFASQPWRLPDRQWRPPSSTWRCSRSPRDAARNVYDV